MGIARNFSAELGHIIDKPVDRKLLHEISKTIAHTLTIEDTSIQQVEAYTLYDVPEVGEICLYFVVRRATEPVYEIYRKPDIKENKRILVDGPDGKDPKEHWILSVFNNPKLTMRELTDDERIPKSDLHQIQHLVWTREAATGLLALDAPVEIA